jgi:hypothetical protein
MDSFLWLGYVVKPITSKMNHPKITNHGVILHHLSLTQMSGWLTQYTDSGVTRRGHGDMLAHTTYTAKGQKQ